RVAGGRWGRRRAPAGNSVASAPGQNKSLLASSSPSSANSTPASAPSAAGRRRWRPALGSKPAASAKARARESSRSRWADQVAALTKVTGTVVAEWPRRRKRECIGRPFGTGPASTQRVWGEGEQGRSTGSAVNTFKAPINFSLRLTIYCRNPSGRPDGGRQ